MSRFFKSWIYINNNLYNPLISEKEIFNGLQIKAILSSKKQSIQSELNSFSYAILLIS